MPMDCVPVDALLITTLLANIFGNGGMIRLPLYLHVQLNKDKCV